MAGFCRRLAGDPLWGRPLGGIFWGAAGGGPGGGPWGRPLGAVPEKGLGGGLWQVFAGGLREVPFGGGRWGGFPLGPWVPPCLAFAFAFGRHRAWQLGFIIGGVQKKNSALPGAGGFQEDCNSFWPFGCPGAALLGFCLCLGLWPPSGLAAGVYNRRCAKKKFGPAGGRRVSIRLQQLLAPWARQRRLAWPLPLVWNEFARKMKLS